MPGGLLNIVAYGAANIILNGNPSKTFFKAVYKKYTNFGLQRFRLDFEGQRNLSFNSDTVLEFKVKRYAELFVEAGSDHLTFHIEGTKEPEKLIEYIHSLGVTCGVCLNPETPVEAIEEVAQLCDMILVMTVHPGFGSQKFIESAAKKCKRIREILGARVRVEVDGGINPVTAPIAVSYGADTFVAGSAVFSKPDRAKAVEAIVSACMNTKSCQLPNEQ